MKISRFEFRILNFLLQEEEKYLSLQPLMGIN